MPAAHATAVCALGGSEPRRSKVWTCDTRDAIAGAHASSPPYQEDHANGVEVRHGAGKRQRCLCGGADVCTTLEVLFCVMLIYGCTAVAMRCGFLSGLRRCCVTLRSTSQHLSTAFSFASLFLPSWVAMPCPILSGSVRVHIMCVHSGFCSHLTGSYETNVLTSVVQC